MARAFIGYQPTVEDYWTGLILFGRNTTSFKFALGRALLDLKPSAGQLITLQELAEPFATHLCDHMQSADKQGTSPRGLFLDACAKANAGELSHTELVEQTVRLGFQNVIDAFHILGGKEIPRRFFLDERGRHGGIRVTDAFAELVSGHQYSSLPLEAEARWKLVEAAWELEMSVPLVAVRHDSADESLFVRNSTNQRRPITGAREALSGYQKGQCFYCYDAISVVGSTKPDVDHFFPHVLKQTAFVGQLDGIWNLVLACQRCNRGVGGKSARVPTIKLLERLSARNEFLIDSHHPLRETLIDQTARSENGRRTFLTACHAAARKHLIHEWEPDECSAPLF